jgi:hypothetical protein
MVYMWQIDGRKDCAITWGGLTDVWKQESEARLKQDLL